MATQRTDPHRPGAIIPAHYTCEVDYAAPSTCGGFPIPGFRWDCTRDLAIIERDADGKIVKEISGAHGTHERGLCCITKYLELNPHARAGLRTKCDVCGAHFKRGSAFRYDPTGEVVVMGHDCAAKYELMYDDSEAELHRKRQERALATYIARAQNAKERAAFLAKHEGLEAALALGSTDEGAPRGASFLADLRSKLVTYRSLSDKQVAAALRVAAEIIMGPKEKPAEPPKVPAPVSKDRVVIEGTIVHTEWKENDFGGALKMLLVVATPAGEWKAWGTVPAGLEKPEAGYKGLAVKLVARVEVSGRDPSFAFLSRPTVWTPPAPKKPRAKKAPAFQRKARALKFDHGSPYREVRQALARAQG